VARTTRTFTQHLPNTPRPWEKSVIVAPLLPAPQQSTPGTADESDAGLTDGHSNKFSSSDVTQLGIPQTKN